MLYYVIEVCVSGRGEKAIIIITDGGSMILSISRERDDDTAFLESRD